VTGEQSAKLYAAKNGIIEEIEPHTILNPRYTDREGFFAEKRDAEFASGSVYEPKKLYIRTKFLHWLRDEIDHLDHKSKFASIYLFSPDFMTREVYAILPDEICDRIRFNIRGNLVEERPFILLRRIRDEIEKIIGQKVPRKEDARKLLGKDEFRDIK
ncbi:MAG: hypothetical protein AAB906_01150, partial [Patescibacteria group bacterium]